MVSIAFIHIAYIVRKASDILRNGKNLHAVFFESKMSSSLAWRGKNGLKWFNYFC